MPHPDYIALRAKVDDFARRVADARDDMRCRAGCSSCCHARLEICDVEADAMREALAAAGEALREELRASLEDRRRRPHAPCVMLDDEGRCRAYEARPLVCRTQGLALRYPQGLVPIEAVRGRAGDGDVVHCPLNFDERAPGADEVLDAGRVDQMLALVNARATDADHRLRRTSLEALVEETLSSPARDVR